jgi:hypothetical protein
MRKAGNGYGEKWNKGLEVSMVREEAKGGRGSGQEKGEGREGSVLGRGWWEWMGTGRGVWGERGRWANCLP